MRNMPDINIESHRVAALKRLHLLDSEYEDIYDSIAKLAAEICETPIALVSLVDTDRLWFKAVFGLEGVREVSNHMSFCSETVSSHRFLEVCDATKDPRFSKNPLITDKPNFCFYAGHPLVDSNQFAVGTLCVIDYIPRLLNETQKKQLAGLAELVIQIFEKRAIRLNLMQQAMNRELDAVKQYRQTPAMTYSVDAQGKLLKVSNHWCNQLGYKREDVIGRPIIEFLTKSSRPSVLKGLPKFFLSGCCTEVPLQILKKNHEVMDVLLSVSSDFDHDNQIIRSWAVIVDVTERNRLALALESEKERVQVTLHSIGDSVISTDQYAIVDYLNPVAEQMTGWSLAEARGKPLTEVFNIINEVTREPAVNPVWRCLSEGLVLGLANHTVLIHRDGREFSIEDSAAPIRTARGEIVGAVLVFHDVTNQRQLQSKIIFQARHDELTGLINRSAFDVQLKELLVEASEQKKEHALCYLDLDQFKLVNDTCGHAAGDELLQQLSGLFHSKVRKNDTLARLGGDEFGLLLRDCSLDDAQRIATLFLAIAEEFRFSWQEKSFKIGVSIGLVPITSASHSPESVLQTADTACYAAKEAGRNRIYLLREQDDEFARRHVEMQWYSRIPRALDENQFILYAQLIQPINASSSDKLHFEILLRLKGESGEIIPPGAFMPAAERYNLANSVDRWVVTHTFRWLASNPAVVERLGLCAINLSGQSLGDSSFYSFILEQFNQEQIPFEKICFELTETAAVANLANAIDFMQKLRALRCSFSLDDFGSGLSSFGYLKALPVDILKIDGLFVRDIVDDPVDLALVRSINEIAHLLGKKTVAEYVENDAILQSLKKLGVDYGQGYGISIPMPLDSLASN
jgi:diguanylate cyclase (GGDEF)-like protein/PAS domain S-box-containing protein